MGAIAQALTGLGLTGATSLGGYALVKAAADHSGSSQEPKGDKDID